MGNRPTVSAMLYVKNEEEFSPFAILSIYNVVDEIVVVDNGSTDQTRERLSVFEKVRWFENKTEDFSELGNFALSKCKGDWILYLGGDEVFYQDIEQVLPILIQYDKIDGYTCRFFNLMFSWDRMQNINEHDSRFQRIFLFRNRPEVHFINPLHESLVGIGPVIADSGLHYVHYGYAKPMSFILKKLKQYAIRMGEPYFYEGRTESHMLQQAERRPFPYEHPKVIKDYIAQKGGHAGIEKPLVDCSQLKIHLDQCAASAANAVTEEPEKKARSLEIACLPNCISLGFEHMDIRPLPHVDIVGDIRNIPIADNSYDEVIVPGYLMEHLPYQDIGKALRECLRIAKEGGRVMVRIYDGLQIATAYAKGELSNESFNRLLFGDDRDGWERHRCMLDNATLCSLMEKAGFENVGLEYYENWMVQISGRKAIHHSSSQAIPQDIFLPHIGRLKTGNEE
ncbi:glycosyltransferase [Brevibacillus borstelensis]|uniref:glycosyltransferase n=1 Tax=Brevibacillus borstelensis TaxID=45462 RepID=UPI0030C06949